MPTISVSDYIFQKIAALGVRDVFMVSGGGIMYLCDALGRSEALDYWCNYHEQACAIAAESYARVREGLGVCLVTTGPGGTNALTGVAGAYVDSIPMLVISGQVRTQIIADYSFQRQVGPQEINIIPMAAPVTKYAVTVMEASRVRYEIEKCLYLALHGRPGPTWINLPLDIQSAMIDPDQLEGFVPENDGRPVLAKADVARIAAMLVKAKRPVLIGGNGVVLAGARAAFSELLEKLSIPALCTVSALDLLAEDMPLYQGRFGPIGQRRGNFALQNADFVLAIGTSLSISCVGFNDNFAPRAEKVLVNIDAGDLVRDNITIHHSIHADAKQFIEQLSAQFTPGQYAPIPRWLEACAAWKCDYPITPAPEFLQQEQVDSYLLYEELSRQLSAHDVLVSGNSTDGGTLQFQAHRVKAGQRAFTSIFGSMGWDLPALVGASIADRARRNVLVTGDGSVLFNIQELLVLSKHRLNSKLIIVNNNGYQSIRNTQSRFFEGRMVGADEASGITNPDFQALAQAFRLDYLRIETNAELAEGLARAFADDKPWIIEVIGSQQQQRFRTSSFRKPDGTLASRPIEDMDPPLPRDELERNMTLFKDNAS